MPLSLKLPEGFIPSYCKMQTAGLETDVAGHAGEQLQQGLPFANGDDLLRRGKRKQLVEPPDAAETQRIVRRDHFSSKNCQLVGGCSRSQS